MLKGQSVTADVAHPFSVRGITCGYWCNIAEWAQVGGFDVFDSVFCDTTKGQAVGVPGLFAPTTVDVVLANAGCSTWTVG